MKLAIMAGSLKLAALDGNDLIVVSAHCQDALTKLENISYNSKAAQITLRLNRYVWENKGALRRFFATRERRLSALTIDRVTSVRKKGLEAVSSDGILSLLAITFQENDNDLDPAGTMTLHFAGGAALAIDVECIEARLVDIGGAWEAARKPHHAGRSDA